MTRCDEIAYAAGTLADVKREFATAWRRWLVKTGKDEKTHRPFYGRPMDERTATIPGSPEPD